MPLRPRQVVLSLVLLGLTALSTWHAWGLAYSLSLIAILGSHEMGHFLMCRRHGVASTPPFFLPFPFSPFGTFGAVILIQSRFPDRRSLFDMGAAGPWAGILVALPLTLFGLARSEVVPAAGPEFGGIVLGDSLLFRALQWIALGSLAPGQDIVLDPIALAGWFGVLVTGLNLLPVGQLDGGHVVYALLGEKGSRRTTRIALAAFAALTVAAYLGWALFLLLVWRFASRHPPTLDDSQELDPVRRAMAIASIVLFFLAFMPQPFLGFPTLWEIVEAAGPWPR